MPATGGRLFVATVMASIVAIVYFIYYLGHVSIAKTHHMPSYETKFSQESLGQAGLSLHGPSSQGADNHREPDDSSIEESQGLAKSVGVDQQQNDGISNHHDHHHHHHHESVKTQSSPHQHPMPSSNPPAGNQSHRILASQLDEITKHQVGIEDEGLRDQFQQTKNNPKQTSHMAKQRVPLKNPDIKRGESVDVKPNLVHPEHGAKVSGLDLSRAEPITASTNQFGEQERRKFLMKMERVKDEERKKLMEEWQKLREEKQLLREDKIRWQKELGQWIEEEDASELQRAHEGPVDPAQWQGLNYTQVQRRYPGIIFHPEYKIRDFIDLEDPMAAGMVGRPQSMDNLTNGQAEERFYQLVTTIHIDCDNIQRHGNTGDGGWDLCVAEPYKPKKGCIIYSFGINYDFTFDDAMAGIFGCQVWTFDPSMNVGDHMHSTQVYFHQMGLGAANTVSTEGWKLQTMGSLMKNLGHLRSTVDMLKLDIEHNEWSCLKTMLKEGVLRNFKQLALEVHTPEVYAVNKHSMRDDFQRMYAVLHGLEEQGFRKFHFHSNPLGKYNSLSTGKQRTCCYELYYLNIRLLQ